MWFRDDLRVADNPALAAAMAAGPTMALYILDEQSRGIRPLGGAARWWLHHALEELREPGPARGAAAPAPRCGGATSCPGSWPHGANRACIGTAATADPNAPWTPRAKEVAPMPRESTAHSHAGTLLHEPWVLLTQDGRPLQGLHAVFQRVQRLPLRPVLGRPATPRNPVPPPGLGQ